MFNYHDVELVIHGTVLGIVQVCFGRLFLAWCLVCVGGGLSVPICAYLRLAAPFMLFVERTANIVWLSSEYPDVC